MKTINTILTLIFLGISLYLADTMGLTLDKALIFLEKVVQEASRAASAALH